MEKRKALLTLVHLSDKELSGMTLEEIRTWLGAMRCLSHQLERAILNRSLDKMEGVRDGLCYF